MTKPKSRRSRKSRAVGRKTYNTSHLREALRYLMDLTVEWEAPGDGVTKAKELPDVLATEGTLERVINDLLHHRDERRALSDRTRAIELVQVVLKIEERIRDRVAAGGQEAVAALDEGAADLEATCEHARLKVFAGKGKELLRAATKQRGDSRRQVVAHAAARILGISSKTLDNDLRAMKASKGPGAIKTDEQFEAAFFDMPPSSFKLRALIEDILTERDRLSH
ncbi:MAG: hypothetical protein RIF41_05080 [Polyangiaceae bacterium]